MRKVTVITLSEIPKQAKKIAGKLKGGEIFALIGPLGSGKTSLVQAVAKQLKIKHKVTSPTFTLLHAFPARLKTKKEILFYHLDLYRTKNFRETAALGLTEFWGNSKTVTFIEWANKITRHLPKKTTKIRFLSR